MWVVSRAGFYSVVQKVGDPGLTVRARVRQDLVNLLSYLPGAASAYEIRESPTNDYGYRLQCSHKEWAEALAALALEIDYDNFKSEIGKLDRKRESILHKVWDALYDLTRLNPGHKGFGLDDLGLGPAKVDGYRVTNLDEPKGLSPSHRGKRLWFRR
jgi:hypothetical protein